ncbi:prealbumin-like fold domain-containing protein [Vagococcus carniphilus]|uniref:prealbumin-like fold domain-containing protein n=1 Tax=Vagococcus carniphilus TaxID=218144 RepID=UPI0028924537|nr:prealbumin-like fold domain-containing protein [Vagococcus carniphilus]MDT2831301.1 prealbumin-like fold domain-containing protein [Vagococcus carniphilus]MDT2840365.1 prealbumin-like fold domain-containing protein [Vagococcus carniphilus]MDT2848968.1 prealbumin-like fold domain-containing protein [Vagococcus carniphilus]MDT2854870.1 prealbumin-like fold domain-containing protein [Vagococcus carniphilus]
MKRLILWFSLFLFSLISISTLEVRAEEQVAIHFKHNNQSANNTSFLIYGLSKKEYNEALSQKVEMSTKKTRDYLEKNQIEKMQEFLVDDSNQAILYLPKNRLGEPAFYVILQNQPEASKESEDELYEALPNYISFETLEEMTMSVETKPVSLTPTAYFFKYSSGAYQKPLENAVFIFYRMNAKNEKEYLTQVESTSWQVLTNKQEAMQFKSDSNGLVMLPHIILPVGTYYFEEIEAPLGFSITAESKKIPLVVSNKDQENVQMMLNHEILESKIAGELPKKVINQATPKVLNEPVTTSKEIPKIRLLPKTGESVFAFSSLGLIMMFVALKYMKRGKENE